MKHITKRYGMETNELILTHEELKELEPFLKALGIRCRSTISDSQEVMIEAENPYKTWAGHPDCKHIADDQMTDFGIKCYKR